MKLPWRKACPPDHDDDKVDSDPKVVNKELSLDLGDRFGSAGFCTVLDRVRNILKVQGQNLASDAGSNFKKASGCPRPSSSLLYYSRA